MDQRKFILCLLVVLAVVAGLGKVRRLAHEYFRDVELVPLRGVERDGHQLSDLIEAMIFVECSDDYHKIGDTTLNDKAYGPLQIRQPFVDDVNRWCGTHYRAEDMLGNRVLSVWVFHQVVDHYASEERLGRVPTFEDYARIWNGGPDGYRKSSTNAYWAKVKARMESQSRDG